MILLILSRDLYSTLEDKGWYTGFKKCGSLWVAKKPDKYCKKKDSDGTKANDACLVTCGTCD